MYFYSIFHKIFQDGGSAELNIPQSVSILSPPCSLNKDATIADKQKIAIIMAQYKQKKSDMYSLWCDTLYKLSIANHVCFHYFNIIIYFYYTINNYY